MATAFGERLLEATKDLPDASMSGNDATVSSSSRRQHHRSHRSGGDISGDRHRNGERRSVAGKRHSSTLIEHVGTGKSVLTNTVTSSNSNYTHSFLFSNLKNPPERLKHIENLQERQMIVTILCTLCSFTKSSTNLKHGIEDCSSYYKVFSSGFRERITMDDMFSIYQLNNEIGWLQIRDIHAEMDTRRIVVEMNKEASRQYQPPPESKIQHYERIINGNISHAGSSLAMSMSPGMTIASNSAYKRRRRAIANANGISSLISAPPNLNYSNSIRGEFNVNANSYEKVQPHEGIGSGGFGAIFTKIKNVLQSDDEDDYGDDQLDALSTHDTPSLDVDRHTNNNNTRTTDRDNVRHRIEVNTHDENDDNHTTSASHIGDEDDEEDTRTRACNEFTRHSIYADDCYTDSE